MEKKSMYKIAYTNEKGGTGKTTCAINTAFRLAQLGYSTLLFDGDDQGAATTGIGFNPDDFEQTVYEVLIGTAALPDVIVSTRYEKLHLAPANWNLGATKTELIEDIEVDDGTIRTWDTDVLQQALQTVEDAYDFVVFDCPPGSLGGVSLATVAAIDIAVVPVQCEDPAVRALTPLMRTLFELQEEINPQLHIHILRTIYDQRKLHHQEAFEDIATIVSELQKEIDSISLSKAVIKDRTAIPDATKQQQPVLLYKPNSEVTGAFQLLTREVIELCQQHAE
jgi:chromosome partitioning protein